MDDEQSQDVQGQHEQPAGDEISSGTASYPTADEIASKVDEVVTPKVTGALADSEGRITSATTSGFQSMDSSNEIALVSPETMFDYLPEGSAAYCASYLTPFLWGIAAGFVAYLLGFVWESFTRLLGLARPR